MTQEAQAAGEERGLEIDDDIVSRLSEESRAEFEAMRAESEASETETSGDGAEAEGQQPEGEQQPQPRRRGRQQQAEQPTPLEGLTFEQILQHPELGPQLQSWKDRTSYQERQAERARWEAEAQDRAIMERFSTMSNEDLVDYLNTTPGGHERYAEFVSRTRAQREAAENEQAALMAKTYAMSNMIDETIEELRTAGIEASGDLDPNAYVAAGEQGFMEWRKKATAAARRAEAQKIYEAELKGNVDVATQERLAERDAQRPPALLPNGRAASPDRIDFDNITAEELADMIQKDPSIRKQYAQVGK